VAFPSCGTSATAVAPQLENELAAKQDDVDAALLQLVEKEPIIVRLPAQLKYIEIRGKPDSFLSRCGRTRSALLPIAS